MAIKLFLRSKTGATSTIYFRYTRGRDFKLILKTPYCINPEFWDDKQESYNPEQIVKRPKKESEKKLNTELINLDDKLSGLRSELSIFFINNPDSTIEEIKEFYNNRFFPQKNIPKINKTTIPTDFVSFIDYYIKEKSKRIEGKQEPITEATRKKLTKIKNRIILIDKKLQLKNIDDDFRDELTEWMQDKKYSSKPVVHLAQINF
jgi:hypothetical protein